MERICFGQRVASWVCLGIAVTASCSTPGNGGAEMDAAVIDAAEDVPGDDARAPSPMIDARGGGSVDGAPPTEEDPVLVGAGDIGACDSRGDEATADLLD